MLIVLALALALSFELVRRQRNETLILEYQYRFFGLRDNLREFAMENPAAARQWVFQYLDSTTAKTIKILPELSLWYVLGLWLTHRKDASIDKAKKALVREYEKPQNKTYREFEQECFENLAEFMLSRHRLLVIVSILALVLPAAITKAIREIKRRSLELVIESPETSTLHQFVPATS